MPCSWPWHDYCIWSELLRAELFVILRFCSCLPNCCFFSKYELPLHHFVLVCVARVLLYQDLTIEKKHTPASLYFVHFSYSCFALKFKKNKRNKNKTPMIFAYFRGFMCGLWNWPLQTSVLLFSYTFSWRFYNVENNDFYTMRIFLWSSWWAICCGEWSAGFCYSLFGMFVRPFCVYI